MKNRFAVILVVLIALMLSLSACGVAGDLKTVNQTGKAFMGALEKGDNAASWALLTPAVQTEIGGEAAWADWTSIRNFPKWSFNNTEINNNTGQMDGTAELEGYEYTVTLIFEKSGESWLISGINFE